MKRSFLLFFAILLTVFSISESSLASATTKDERAKQLPYWIEVDLTHSLVLVYSPSDNSLQRTMIASAGRKRGWTPTGTFYLPTKSRASERTNWYSVATGFVRYATRIEGPILFHSVLYDDTSMKTIDKESVRNLGTPASHGCIRLTPLDAQWIAYNCPAGTRVVIHYAKKDSERKRLNEALYSELSPADSEGHMGKWEALAGLEPSSLTVGGSDSSYNVMVMQERLRSIGYYDGKIDGRTGSELVLAIMNFQEAMGYEATGLSDGTLMDILYDTDVALGPYVTIERGGKSIVVEEIQEKLKAQGYYTGAINGVYEKPLKEAVDKYCLDNGLARGDDTIISPGIQASILASGAPEPKRTPKPGYSASAEGDDGTDGDLSAGEYARVILDKEGSTLNLRKTEDTDSDVLAVIPHLAFIEIVETGERYYKVLYDGIEGYASAKYISSAS